MLASYNLKLLNFVVKDINSYDMKFYPNLEVGLFGIIKKNWNNFLK